MIKSRKVSTTTYPITFLMVDSADHVTGKAGLTVTVTLSKNGGAFGAAAGAVSELSSGWYSLAGNATDRNTLGDLAIHCTAAGADPTDMLCTIVDYDPFAIPESDWTYASRTLTQAAASVTSAVSGSTLTIQRGDTFSATLTGLSANTGYVSIDFSVKTSPADADTAALIRIRKNASGLSDGLLYLNGAAGTAAQGSITVNSATSLTITLAAAAADDLTPVTGLYYDVQYIFASSVTTATSGVCNVSADITRAVA